MEAQVAHGNAPSYTPSIPTATSAAYTAERDRQDKIRAKSNNTNSSISCASKIIYPPNNYNTTYNNTTPTPYSTSSDSYTDSNKRPSSHTNGQKHAHFSSIPTSPPPAAVLGENTGLGQGRSTQDTINRRSDNKRQAPVKPSLKVRHQHCIHT